MPQPGGSVQHDDRDEADGTRSREPFTLELMHLYTLVAWHCLFGPSSCFTLARSRRTVRNPYFRARGVVSILWVVAGFSINQSIVIGFAASVVSNIAVHWKSKSTLDDTLDVFPCHGVGGIVGMVFTGLLARDVGLFWGPTTTFIHHMLAIVIVGAFTLVGSMLL